ncbi:MAG: hypothetical protein FJ090_14765 [Deltaproteobacteria bacterium]|nr:hypothetical protein [Deltaproteobacteria bacterium]
MLTFHVERAGHAHPRPWAVVAVQEGSFPVVAVVVATFDRVTDAMAEAARRERAESR